jgi:RNA polymerase-binding transcription factor DksA
VTLKNFLQGVGAVLAAFKAEAVTRCDECDAPIPATRRRHALRVGVESRFCSERCSARARKRRQRERETA